MEYEVKKCSVISGAPDSDIEFIKNHIDYSSYIICADSGYLKCCELGIIPNLIIGDFDSSAYPDCDCEIIRLNPEKAYTDTFHCIMEAIERGYNKIEVYSALGDRFDHSYSNILCLSYCKKHNVDCEIVNAKNRISLITDSKKIFKEYENFSLFAYLEPCEGVTIKGAYYTAGFYGKESLDFDVDTQCGVSNYVSDDYAEVGLRRGCLLLIESND